MMQSFWEFLRRAACDAVLAGVEDAVRLLEQGRSSECESRAAGQLATRLTKVVVARINSESPTKAEEPPATVVEPPLPEPAYSQPKSSQAPELFDSPTEPVPSLTSSRAGHLQTGPRVFVPRGRKGRRHHSNHDAK